MVEHFADRLERAIRQRRTPALVGLDPRRESLPEPLLPSTDAGPEQVAAAFEQFCCAVIDVVADLVPAVKPQAAFFEQLGPAGMTALHATITHARRRGLLVILDGKRNDIGSTAAAYADGWLTGDSDAGAWGADALTVSPYLGADSLAPFVETAVQRGAGLFVLVRTSNPGAASFQDQDCQGHLLYEKVAGHVEGIASASRGSGRYGAVGAVAGATWPRQLESLRAQMPHTWFLVPGFGAQGATARDVAAAFDDAGTGALVNSSRAIIFAYRRPEYEALGQGRWQDAVAAATREMIGHLADETPAGRLR